MYVHTLGIHLHISSKYILKEELDWHWAAGRYGQGSCLLWLFRPLWHSFFLCCDFEVNITMLMALCADAVRTSPSRSYPVSLSVSAFAKQVARRESESLNVLSFRGWHPIKSLLSFVSKVLDPHK